MRARLLTAVGRNRAKSELVSASAWSAALGDKPFLCSALECSSVLFIVILVVAVGAKWSRECFAVWFGCSLHPLLLPAGALFLSYLPPASWAKTLPVLLFFWQILSLMAKDWATAAVRYILGYMEQNTSSFPSINSPWLSFTQLHGRASWARAGFDRLGPVLRGQVPPHGAGAALCSCRRRREHHSLQAKPGHRQLWHLGEVGTGRRKEHARSSRGRNQSSLTCYE